MKEEKVSIMLLGELSTIEEIFEYANHHFEYEHRVATMSNFTEEHLTTLVNDKYPPFGTKRYDSFLGRRIENNDSVEDYTVVLSERSI